VQPANKSQHIRLAIAWLRLSRLIISFFAWFILSPVWLLFVCVLVATLMIITSQTIGFAMKGAIFAVNGTKHKKRVNDKNTEIVHKKHKDE